MAAGLVIENLAVAQGDALKVALQRGALPVLVVFFVAVGTSLAAGCARDDGRGGDRPGRAPHRADPPRRSPSALRSSDVDRRVGAYAWTGLISQAGITLGLASVLATEFPTWGGQVQMLLVALIADRRAGRAGDLPHRPGARRRARRAARRGRSSSSPTASRTCTTTTATGGIVVLAGDRRRRGGARCADARARRRLDRARRRHRRPRARRCRRTRCSCRPRRPAYHLRRLWLEPRSSPPTTADSPTKGCGRCAIRSMSGRKFRSEDWDGVSDGQRPVRGGHRSGAARHRHARSSSRTTTWRSSRRVCASGGRPRTRRCSGTSRGRIPIGCGSVPWRREILAGLLANDLLAFQLERDRRNFVLAVEEELDAEIEADGARIWFDGPRDAA